MTPTVSVIICTRNRASHLSDTLTALVPALKNSLYSLEILIVDNGSTDSTRNVVETWTRQQPVLNVRYLLEAQKGLSIARNTGCNAAQGDVILFTDDDVRVPDNWVNIMCEPIIAGEYDAIAGGIALAEGLFPENWDEGIRHIFAENSYQKNALAPHLYLIGANMAFRRSIRATIPKFDPNLGAGKLGSHEEYLFSKQLYEAGYRVGNLYSCQVVHFPESSRFTKLNVFKMLVEQGRSTAYIHYHWEHQVIPALLVLRFLRAGFRYWVYYLSERVLGRFRANFITWSEKQAMLGFGYFSQLIRDANSPRNYEERGGEYKPPCTPYSCEDMNFGKSL